MKTYSGYTSKTPEHLLLDAGAFFKNFDVTTDTFDTAVASGKLLGATRDGGEFKATPSIRQIKVDGIKGRAKGLDVIDTWETYIKANVMEITKEVLVSSLASASVDESTNEKYDIIKANGTIQLSDYVDNITWVGTLSGSDEPVIIVVKNVLNTEGLTLTTKDADNSVIAMTFYGTYDQSDLESPPFEIYYPKKKTV